MKINELTRDQLAELKIGYYAGILTETENRGITDCETRDIDRIVPDAEIRHFYADVLFSPEDFACAA